MPANPLIARLEEAGGGSRELDAEIARAIGWSQRIVTRIGLNGRTPGRLTWFGTNGRPTTYLPKFSSARNRTATLKAIAAAEGDMIKEPTT
jgi:hypothetical protein